MPLNVEIASCNITFEISNQFQMDLEFHLEKICNEIPFEREIWKKQTDHHTKVNT